MAEKQKQEGGPSKTANTQKVKHGDRVGVAWRIKDIATNEKVEESAQPHDYVVVDNRDSWHYLMVGRALNYGKKAPLDENKKLCSKDKAKYSLVFLISEICAPPEEEKKKQPESKKQSADKGKEKEENSEEEEEGEEEEENKNEEQKR